MGRDIDSRSMVATGAGLLFICIGWVIAYLLGFFWVDVCFTILGVILLIIGIVTFFIPDIGKIVTRIG